MWDRLVHDFGEVDRNQKLTTKFIYSGPLTIEKWKASCGCTVASLKEVNDRQVLDVTFNTGHKVRSVNKTITVLFTNQTTVKLRVTAKII